MARNRYYLTPHWRALKRACHERDNWRCVACGSSSRLVCDHIRTRPNVDYPTPADVLTNTRTLCDDCDRRIKERANGARRRDGNLIVRGCTADGSPLDPRHPWHKGKP